MFSHFASTKKRLAVALIAAVLLSSSASAATIMISYSATVSQGYGTLSNGTVLSGSFTFDDSLASFTVNSGGSYYNNYLSSLSLGSETITNPNGFAQIANNNANYNGDLVSLTTNYPAPGAAFTLGGMNGVALGFLFYSPGNSALIGTEGLSSLTNLSLANSQTELLRFFQGGSGPGQGSFLGEAVITNWQASSVPDQGPTLALLGLGLTGLVALRRRLVRG